MSSNLFAQEEQSFNLTDFSGGLDSLVSQFAIPNNKATIANNVRFNNVYGGIAKREGMLSFGTLGSSAVTSMHRFYKSDSTKQLLVTGSTLMQLGSDSAGTFTTIGDGLSDGKRWTWVTYKDIAIGMNGTDNAKKYDGHTINNSQHRWCKNSIKSNSRFRCSICRVKHRNRFRRIKLVSVQSSLL